MNTFEVALGKMKTEAGQPVRYFMDKEKSICVNDWIGKTIKIKFEGKINCIVCGRSINKTFGQGFCYPCFRDAPEASECVLRPELCEGHLGKGRDVEWEKKHHVQPHIVYLAKSSAVKVGITREVQVPFRWIDQGASAALPIIKCPNRYEAGRVEVALKSLFTDKTSWQKMLKNDVNPDLDLIKAQKEALEHLGNDIGDCEVLDADVYQLNFPVDQYPLKVKSIKLDKIPEIEARLNGIKGQYLLLDENRVINIRNHSGYQVMIDV